MKLLSIIFALLILATLGFAADQNKNAAGDHEMSAMAHAIMRKSGDDFEAAFLMILHQQGGAKMWSLGCPSPVPVKSKIK